MPTPVVAVLNMKGGVGKTTLAVNVSREIFETEKKSVLLIDLDPQYNMTQQLIDRTQYDEQAEAGKTSLRLFEPAPVSDFFDVNISNIAPGSADELSRKLFYFPDQPDKHISIVAGTFELTKYSFISDQSKLDHARTYFRRVISNTKAEYDLIILDMNPSSSFLTLCGLGVATDILSPVRPDKFSVLGLELVKKLIDHPLAGCSARLHIVMNGVTRSHAITDTEADIRQADFFKDRILTHRVHQSKILSARPDYTGFPRDRPVAHKRAVSEELRKVGVELCGKIGL